MSVPSWNGRALACALDFSLACALDLLWAETWSNTDQYCVAGALLACEEGRSRSESGGLSLTCVAPFAETGTPCIVDLLPCLHVAGVTLSSSYITFVWQYECKPLWLHVIILCTCQCSSPFWCACEGTFTSHTTPPQMRMLMSMSKCHCDWTSLFRARVSAHSVVRMWKSVNIPPFPTPHHTTPAHLRMLMNMNVISQGVGWLWAVSVRKWVKFMSLSAQVRKFPVSKWVCVFWNRVALAKAFDRLLNPVLGRWREADMFHSPTCGC